MTFKIVLDAISTVDLLFFSDSEKVMMCLFVRFSSLYIEYGGKILLRLPKQAGSP